MQVPINALDIILVLVFIFMISWLLRIFLEVPGLESGLFGCIILFLYLVKSKTVLIIHYSPLLSLLYSAVIFSIIGVILTVAMYKAMDA